MRPKLPKSPIVIEDHDDDSESSSTDSDESEVSLSDLRERIKKNKIVERLQELYNSESSSTEEEDTEDVKRNFSNLQTAMSAGLQCLVSKLKESSQFPPLRSIKTEIQADSQMEQNQSSVNSIKIEVESGPQTLPHVQIKEEPEDWEWEHLNDLDLAVDPGCVKTEPQEPCHHTNQDNSQARQDVYRYLSDAVKSGCRVVLEEGLAIMKTEGVDICLSPLLHVAVKYDQVSVAECLLENGADPNARDKNGCDVLYKACSSCKYCSFEMVKVLLKYGATVWNNGPTSALHEAAANGNVATCELLIKHGADPKMRNSSGLTPLEVVLHGPLRNRTDLVCLLRSSNLASKNSNPIASEEVLPISSKSTDVSSESPVNNHNPPNNHTVKHTNCGDITSEHTENDHNPLNNNTVKHTNCDEITSEPTVNEQHPVNTNTLECKDCIENKKNTSDSVSVTPTADLGNEDSKGFKSKCTNVVTGADVEKPSEFLASKSNNTSKSMFHCRACKEVFFELEECTVHLVSEKHKENLRKKGYLEFKDGNRCKLCQVRYIKCKNCKCKNCKAKVCEAGKVCRAKKRRHLSTKRHKEMVKWLAIDITVEGQMDDRGLVSKSADKMADRTEEKLLKPVNNKEIVIHCKLCKRIFTDRTQAEIHINSSKHKRNVNGQQRNAGRVSDSTHKCEVCQVLYVSSAQQMQHLLGKKHRSMLKWLASGCLIDISMIEQTAQAGTGPDVQTEPTAPVDGNMTGTSAAVAPPTQCSSKTQNLSRKDTGKPGKPDMKMGVPPNDGGWITVGKRKAESDEDSRRKLKKFCVVSPIKHSIPSRKDGTFSSRVEALGRRKSAVRKKSDKQKGPGELSQAGYCPWVSNIKSGRINNSPCGSKDCRMLRKSKKGSKSLHELKQKSQIMKARKRKRKRKMKTPN